MTACQAWVTPRLANTRAVVAITPATTAQPTASTQDVSPSARLVGSSLPVRRIQIAVVALRPAHAAPAAAIHAQTVHAICLLNVPPVMTRLDSATTRSGPAANAVAVPIQDLLRGMPMEIVMPSLSLESKEDLACTKCGRRASFFSPIGLLCPTDALLAAAFHDWIPAHLSDPALQAASIDDAEENSPRS